MKVEILLARTGGESRGAVLTDGVLTDYRVGRADRPSRVGGVYRARVKVIMPGLAGAIAEIPSGEAWLDLARARIKPREGAIVTIQIVQDAQGGKRARASAEPLIAGRFLALRPLAAKSALSHRIADNDARARLGALLRQFGRAGGAFLALHTAPAATDAMLAAEAERLRRIWREAATALDANAPAEAIAPVDPALDLLRLFVGPSAGRIAVDSEALAASLRDWLALHAPEWKGKLEREPVGRTTLESEAVRAELAAAVDSEVPLPGGGALAIGAAAGTTVIDVDTERAASASAKATFASVNREAAHAIARQIRLRNLGGRIVVDFAGLGQARALAPALGALRAGVAADPMAVRIAAPSEFGLVELLRRRERLTLAEMLATP